MSSLEPDLAELLTELFSDEELRRLLQRHELHKDLPGPASTLIELASAAAGLLRRRGMVDASFFTLLLHERPHRRGEILRLQRTILQATAPASEALWADGRYRLQELLGEGGFAEVWKAVDNTSAEYVTLKILRPEHLADVRKRQRFLRGAQVLGKLRHPGLVTMRTAEMYEGLRLFSVLDYVEGVELTRLASEPEALPALLHNLAQIGDALEHVHDHDWVHRDVKPGNILVTPHGNAKLLDFDLVSGANFTDLTRTAPLGSLPFTAPEILDGADEVTSAADVYSLAMTTVFVLRRGRMPPSTALRDPDALFRQVPEAFALRDALTAALHLDPERRTRRARDFSAALRNAYPPGTTTRARLVVLTEPVAATTPPVLPTFDEDGSLHLWDAPPAPRLPELELAGLRMWPALAVAAAIASPRRAPGEYDVLVHDYRRLTDVAAVLAIAGRRPAWLGLTRRETSALVLSSGHVVLYDRSLPPADDLALARRLAREPGVPVAVVDVIPTDQPRTADVVELSREIRRGAHYDAALRELARFSRSGGATPFDLRVDRHTEASSPTALQALIDRGLPGSLLALSGPPGSGRTHTLRRYAEHLASKALIQQGLPAALVGARGWQPPFRLYDVLRAAGHEPATIAALRLAVTAGECVLLLDDLEIPAVPVGTAQLVESVERELQAWRGPTSRIALVIGTACPWSAPTRLQLFIRDGALTQVLPAVLDDPVVRTGARESSLRLGTLSLLGVPQLARTLLAALAEDPDAGPWTIAADLRAYLRVWLERIVLHIPGVILEQLQRGCEELATLVWQQAPGIEGDDIAATLVAEVLHRAVDHHAPLLTRNLVDGTLLDERPLPSTTVVRWLVATRRVRTPHEPWPRRAAAPPRSSARAVRFVHSSLLELLLATHITRRLAASADDLLVGPRLFPSLCALCRTDPLWPWARNFIERVLRTGQPEAARANALLLSLGDPSLASSAERPWRLNDIDLAGAALRVARLDGADLAGADFRGADLRDASLCGANLSHANLSLTDLRGADLSGSIARDARLRGAQLSGTRWRGADLRGARLSGSEAPDFPPDLTDALLAGTDLDATLWSEPIALSLSPARFAIRVPFVGDVDDILAPGAFTRASDLAWAPDGTLVTIHYTGHVCVWFARPLRPLRRWRVTGFGNNHLALSPGGRKLLTWSEGQSLRMWDLGNFADVTPPPFATLSVRSATWADETASIALTTQDGALWLWDSGDLRLLTQAGAGSRVAWFVGGDQRLALVTPDSRLRLWDIERGAGETSVHGAPGAVLGVAAAPDRRSLAVQKLDEVTLYTVDRMLAARTSLKSESMATHGAIDWSADGRWIVVPLDRFGPLLWDITAEQWSHHLAGGAAHWLRLSFAPDSTLIAGIRDGDGGLAVWDVQTGAEVESHAPDLFKIPMVALAADRRTLLCSTPSRLLTTTLPELALRELHEFSSDRLLALAPDGGGIVVARDQSLVLADPRGAILVHYDRCRRGDNEAWYDVHFTCDGRHLIARVADDPRHEIVAWERTTGRRILERSEPAADGSSHFKTHTISAAHGVGISGGRIGSRACIEVWRPGAPPRRLQIPEQDSMYTLAVDAAGNWLAAGSSNHLVTLWDLRRWAADCDGPDATLERLRLAAFPTAGRVVDAMQFAPSGALLAVASGDEVVLIDAADRTVMRHLGGHGFRVASLAFDPTGHILVVGDWSSGIRLWDVRTGLAVADLHLTGTTAVVVHRGRVLGDPPTLPGWYAALDGACIPLAHLHAPTDRGHIFDEFAMALADP